MNNFLVCIGMIVGVILVHTTFCSPTNDEKNIDDLQGSINSEYTQRRVIRSAILSKEKTRWDKGIVPFILTDSLTDDNIREIKRGMATYEKYTCIRFVPWTSSSNADYGLGHNGHLNFVKGDTCNADLGNKRSAKGQHISCCDGTKCIHEIGHALGFVHEHQSPEREGWIRVNDENINKEWRKWYKEYDENQVITDGFDIQSIMAYPPDANSQNGDAYTILDAELTWGENFFYLFKQIAKEYKCAETTECDGFTLSCENDGFITLVAGKCACYCPQGLDPATGCKDILKRATVTDFPGGQWALPMTTNGCPDDTFKVGYRKHFTDTDGENVKSTPYHLKGIIDESSAEHYFCVHQGNESESKWNDGNYCIYQLGGECPQNLVDNRGADFESGHINIYDRKNSAYVEPTGHLSDGEYTQSKTKFMFCCRDTGFPNLPIDFPNQRPLALFIPQFTFECQEILGMHSVEEFVGLNSLNYADATYFDSTPFMKVDKGMRRLYIKFCYYVPAVTDCGGIIKLNKSNPSISFSPPTGNQLDCHWHVSVPKGNRVKLELTDMQVSGEMPKNCNDYVEVRHVLMGQTGNKYCGTKDLPAVVSYYDAMMIHFVTYETSSSSFTATFSLVTDDKLCYSPDDKGFSYAGSTSHTKTFQACLPWTDVASCPHHAFKTDDIGKSLDGSYCRNPDGSMEPWCYIDADECERDYCDVCSIGNPIDTADDCQQFKTNGNCDSDPHAMEICAKTCQDSTSKRETVHVSRVSCPFPPSLPDGTLTEALKESYKVGETVDYKCNAEKSTSTITRTCLSSGMWSPAAYVCFSCDPGWNEYRGHCYMFHDQDKSYLEAADECSKDEAILATAKDNDANTFLLGLRRKGISTWLGAQNPDDSDDWSWEDGTSLTWTNWKTGYPELWFFPEQCLLQKSDAGWMDTLCQFEKYPFICEKGPGSNGICADFLNKCEELLAARPSMCTEFPDFSAKSCSRTCKFCQTDSDCEVIAPTHNAMFVHKSIISRKTIPQGTEVYYSCVPNAKQQSGDTVRTCQDGQLSGKELICKKDCSVPSPTENAEFVDTSYKTIDSVEAGTEINYKCKLDSSKESGDTARQCRQDGQFSGSDLVCEKSKASEEFCKLPAVIYPLVQLKPPRSVKQIRIGERAWYWCHRPHKVIQGDVRRICLTGGTLSGSHPLCDY